MKELVIASNMIALARTRKGGNKRSAMLRMIMPFLSKETGDQLAEAITKQNSKKFAHIWDKVKHEIMHKLNPKHLATASMGNIPFTPEGFEAHYNRVKIPLAPVVVDTGCAPATCADTGGVKTTISFETENSAEKYVITDAQICLLINLICQRMLMGADPCPLPECPPEPDPCRNPETYERPVNCAEHGWPDCKACENPTPAFDFNANILELYDKLTASHVQAF